MCTQEITKHPYSIGNTHSTDKCAFITWKHAGEVKGKLTHVVDEIFIRLFWEWLNELT